MGHPGPITTVMRGTQTPLMMTSGSSGGRPPIPVPTQVQEAEKPKDDTFQANTDSDFMAGVWAPMSALGELTANFASNKLAGLGRLFSGGSEDLADLSPPPLGYTSKIFEDTKSILPEEVGEQLYYLFRSAATASKTHLFMSNRQIVDLFAVSLPPEVETVVQCIFLTGTETEISFNDFVKGLTTIKLGSMDAKLLLVFQILVGAANKGGLSEPTSQTMSKATMLHLCSCISKAMEPYHQKTSTADVDSVVEALFESIDFVDKDEFLARARKSHLDWVFCFGLLSFVLNETVEKVQVTKSQFASEDTSNPYTLTKEGFLKKQNELFDKRSYKWCSVDRGFFYYYDDLKNYTTPQRINSLLHAQVEPFVLNDSEDFGFRLDIPPNYSRRFFCNDKKHALQWATVIQANINYNAFPFDARFPLRSMNTVEALVDGKETYLAMLTAIKSAKKEIYLSDWFFSCETYLKRDHPKSEADRIDNLLNEKAKEGVIVCVLLWNETKLATALSSEYVQKKMEALNSNIKVLRHPLAYPVAWSHHQKIVVVDQNIAFLGGLDLCFGRYDDQRHLLFDPDGHTWPGKDYYNPSVSGFVALHEPASDQIDRRKVPRMPWHDVHLLVRGYAARDVATNFIERWNFTKINLERNSPPSLLPSRERLAMVTNQPETMANCQILRSLGDWHLPNLVVPEVSIWNAYLTLIANAQHYIYIENQYFISSLAGAPVVNTIVEKLYEKLVEKIEAKDTFRVIIVLPVHPEGGYKDDASTRFIMNFQLNTISKDNGILSKLQTKFPDVELEDYIQFCCLRAFEKVPNENSYDTEQIYVHTKAMIVDDEYVLIGSANINDRSMCGNRDSEIACLVSGGATQDSRMNDQAFESRKFAFDLRRKLWAEHLGIVQGSPDYELIVDPVSKATTNLLRSVAKRNTEVFREVFPYAPHDGIESLESNCFSKSADSSCFHLLTQIRGTLVQYPLAFLSGTNLAPASVSDLHLNIADADIFT